MDGCEQKDKRQKGTKSKFSTESTTKATRNAAPQLPPKNSEWKSTSTTGSTSYQSMPCKDNLHGVGDHYKRTDSA